MIRNKEEDSKCVACGGPNATAGTTGKPSGDVATVGDVKLFSQEPSSSADQLSSDSTIGKGIKIPLLQGSPLTGFKLPSVSTFSSGESSADVTTHSQSSSASGGGMKISLLQNITLGAPAFGVDSTKPPRDEKSLETDQIVQTNPEGSDAEANTDPLGSTAGPTVQQSVDDEYSDHNQHAENLASHDETFSAGETSDPPQQDTIGIVSFSGHPQNISSVDVDEPPQQGYTESGSSIDANTTATDKAPSEQETDQDSIKSTTERLQLSTHPESTGESNQQDAGGSVIDTFSDREVNLPPQEVSSLADEHSTPPVVD